MRPSGKRHLSWFLKDEYELSECNVPLIQQTFTDTLCLGLVWSGDPEEPALDLLHTGSQLLEILIMMSRL